MKHADLRTTSEIFDDILSSEDLDMTGRIGNPLGRIPDDPGLFDRIAERTGMTWGQVRRHYYRICDQMGVSPDGD